MDPDQRSHVPTSDLKLKLPFLAAAFASFVFSVTLYFAFDEKTAGIFVGLWVPSIHSLGTLLLTDTRSIRERPAGTVRTAERTEVTS